MHNTEHVAARVNDGRGDESVRTTGDRLILGRSFVEDAPVDGIEVVDVGEDDGSAGRVGRTGVRVPAVDEAEFVLGPSIPSPRSSSYRNLTCSTEPCSAR